MRPTPRPLVGAAVSMLLCQACPANARVFTSCTGGDESVTRIRIDEDARTARGPFYNVPTGRTLSYKIKRETTGHLS